MTTVPIVLPPISVSIGGSGKDPLQNSTYTFTPVWYDALNTLVTVANSGFVTPATGDVTGTYPALTVTGINGNPLGTTTPTAGNILVGSGTVWTSLAMSSDGSLSGAGALTLNSNVVSSAKFRQSAATTIVGNSTGLTANVQDLTPSTVKGMLD